MSFTIERTNYLSDKYLSRLGIRRLAGSGIEAIAPFFVLDLMYQIFTRDIMKIPCKQKLKQLKSQWLKTYTAFNKDFFSVYTEAEKSDIIDLMDEFGDSVYNDLIITQVSIRNELPKELSFEDTTSITASMLSNILIQVAKVIWNRVYSSDKKLEILCPYLSRLDYLSSQWTGLYFDSKTTAYVNLNESKVLENAVTQLCNSIVRWLHEQRKETPSEK